MRNFFLAVCLFVMAGVHAQINIEYLGRLDYQGLRDSDLSNLWGYTDELGNEYAIVGVNGTGASNPGGVSVVALGDGTDPQEVFFYPGPASIWREVKVWNDHAYITTEANSGGITIVDLSPLPQSTALTATVWQAPDWETSHSLFIDENGRLYLHGADRGNGGVIMYDLTQDPWNPVEVGEYDQWYCHDSYSRGDTLYGAHILDGFLSIIDVSDPSSPVLLGTQATPNDFTHNVWLDDSGDNLFTTDERTNSYVGSYNVSDPTDIQFQHKLRSDNGSGAVPHNTYWLDDYLVTSYYTFGVTIYDALRPDNLVEVGHYDTSPLTGDGFRGAWGVYPFFDSKRLIISDIERGLFVLNPTYVRACWLEGTIRNAVTTVPVGNATISIQGLTVGDLTGIDGAYGTGYHQAGSYTVVVSSPGFETAMITGVQLVNGQVTLLDVELQPLVPFQLSGTVVDALSNEPIEGANVRIDNEDFTLDTVTDSDGNFLFPTAFAGIYSVTVGAWGWITTCPTPQAIDAQSSPLVITLQRGYYDDFVFDNGWTVASTATAGIWERGVPVGTNFNGQISNPNADIQDDCGLYAFVTGNGGGGAGDDDVDGGNTVLTSPVFDATIVWDPGVQLRRWFFNAGGSGNPNDRMRISLTDGTTTIPVQTITASGSSWLTSIIRIQDFLPPTDAMQLIVFIEDQEPGHIVEGGLDVFELVELGTVGVPEVAGSAAFRVWPNPSEGRFSVELLSSEEGLVEVLDATGRRVLDPIRIAGGMLTMELAVPAGSYLIRVAFPDGTRQVQRLVVAH
jgi:choice-of-anchor B domain-containing protein